MNISKPKMRKYTIKDFQNQFPNDDVCLEWLKNYLYPNGIFCNTCDKVTKHHKVASRRSYSCDYCGHHVHPTADTIYHKSTTPLTSWFYAIYLMSSTRCGIAAKQLERELGVTYKTAWRMFKQIRSMLAEENLQLTGKVEIDETYVGARNRGNKRGRGADNKTIVAGAVERGGNVVAKIVPNVKRETLIPFIEETVMSNTRIFTDELATYAVLNRLPERQYRHETVNHVHKVWVCGEAHTNSIEGFWSLLKGGLRGVYRRPSPEYLQQYVNEYAFRYNRRHDVTPMFYSFLGQVRKSSD